VEFLHKGAPYVKYQVALSGKVVLRYGKPGSPNDPISLSGHIEGNGSDFGLWENAILLDDDHNLRNALLIRQTFAPIPSAYVEDLGMIARMATPAYFRVPVAGQLIKGKVILKLLPATHDFADLVRGRVVYIGIIPALPVPAIVGFSIPFQKAHFILTRGMRDNPEFPVVVDNKAKLSLIERVFTREERRGGAEGVLVQWKIQAKACNPGCL
jgi:hypothetical protein